MAEGKKSFVLYCDLINVIDILTDEQAGRLLKTIMEYVNDKDPVINDAFIRLAFEPIKSQLKRDLKDWESKRERRSEAGKKGMVNRWSGITKDNNVIPEITKITVTDTVTVNANVNATATIKENTVRFTPPTKEDVYDFMCTKLDDFTAMAQAEKFFNYYESNGWIVGKVKMKKWKFAVNNWISNITKFSNNGQSTKGTSEARTERAKTW